MLKNSNNLQINKLILLVIITTIIATTLTLSRYRSTKTLADSTKIARPIMTLTSGKSLQLNLDPLEKEQTYDFSISNSLEGKQTEVTMEYTLQINTFNNLPLEIELYKYDDKGQLETTNLLQGNGRITPKVQVSCNKEEVYNYQLKIKWNNTETSYLYSHEIDCVEIILNSNQVN